MTTNLTANKTKDEQKVPREFMVTKFIHAFHNASDSTTKVQRIVNAKYVNTAPWNMAMRADIELQKPN